MRRELRLLLKKRKNFQIVNEKSRQTEVDQFKELQDIKDAIREKSKQFSIYEFMLRQPETAEIVKAGVQGTKPM